MNCDGVRDLLVLRHYDEVTPEQAGAVEKHLASCGDCREESDSLKKLLANIPVPGVPEMPDRFWRENAAQIMDRVQRSSLKLTRSARNFHRGSTPDSHRNTNSYAFKIARQRKPVWKTAFAMWATVAAAAVILMAVVTQLNENSLPREPLPGVGAPAVAEGYKEAELQMQIEDVEIDLAGFWNGGSDTVGESDFDKSFEKAIKVITEAEGLTDVWREEEVSEFDLAFEDAAGSIEASISVLLTELSADWKGGEG